MKEGNHQIPDWRPPGILVAAVLLFLQFQGCAEVPITHRRGLHLVPETELLSMSLQQYDDVLKKSKLSTDTRQVEMVRRTAIGSPKPPKLFFPKPANRTRLKTTNGSST